MLHCGIDLASKASAVCLMTKDGEMVWEGECPTDEDGFRQVLKDQGALCCVIEASPLAEWTALILETLGHQVTVIDPRRAKAVIRTKKKTDQLDAQNLARMSVSGWYTAVHRKSPEARLLRSYLKARAGLVGARNQQVQRIRGILRAHGIKVGQVSAGRYEAKVRELIRIRNAELMPAIEPLLVVLRSLREGEATITRQLRRLIKADATCRLLMTAPGVGELVACCYRATIDDPTRFRRSDQVAAYLGLVPSVYQSGDVDYRGRITKEGDPLLRMLLTEAAHVLLTRTKRDCALKRWGQKLVEHKGHAKAKVAVARKLAMILHRMWMTGEPFQAF